MCAFERDPNELGSIWVNKFQDGAVKFGGKAFPIKDGVYRLENFSATFKDGRECRGIRVLRVEDVDIEAEKASIDAALYGDEAAPF